MKAITNDMTYDSLYRNGAKKSYGDYESKSIKYRKKGSVLSGDYLVVFFEAQFSKEKEGVIAVNLAKERKDCKLMQVQMQKK